MLQQNYHKNELLSGLVVPYTSAIQHVNVRYMEILLTLKLCEVIILGFKSNFSPLKIKLLLVSKYSILNLQIKCYLKAIRGKEALSVFQDISCHVLAK